MNSAATNIFAKLRAGVTTASAEETRMLAAELAGTLPPDSTVALHGDLGVGKTTFVQGLARGFGIKESVTSPTFTIFTVHRSPAVKKKNAPRRTLLLHLDAYRLDQARQVEALMLDDFLVSPWCLAVEWPETIAAWLPKDALHLTLGLEPGGKHGIRLA